MHRPGSPIPGRAPYRVFVVDDHPIVRQGLELLINQEGDLVVCGEAESAAAALETLALDRPDVLVLDVSLNGPDGLDLLKAVRAADSSLPILMLSMHDEGIYAERALRAGANGYIMKQEATEKVLEALRRILGGGVYVSDRLTSKMLQRLVASPRHTDRPTLASLTDRELEVYNLIGEGYGTRQIASRLHLSVKTVESYQAHIKQKLSLQSARALVQHAIEWRLTENVE